MKTDSILIENTLYGLLMYWLVKEVNNTTYILEASNIDKTITDKLKEKYNVYLFYQFYEKPKIYRLFSVYVFQKLKLYFFTKKTLKNNYFIYGNDDLIPFDMFRKFNYHILEDGLSNYIFRKKAIQPGTLMYFFKKCIRGTGHDKSFGRSDKCKTIYLTGISSIPNIIVDKVKIVNLKALWGKKSREEQKEILDIFNITDTVIKKLKSKKIILLTQPISEIGLVSEEEKITIYRNCLSKYDIKDVMIKTHPRETTNYKKYFSSMMIVDTPFPFELIELLDITIDKVVTLFSAVALTLDKDIEVEWLGASVHKKLYEHYGNSLDLENIKNNKAGTNEKT